MLLLLDEPARRRRYRTVVPSLAPQVDLAFAEHYNAQRTLAEEGAMPQYQFFCKACQKEFSVVLTLAEYNKGGVKCPKCGGGKVEQRWAAFYAVTSKKS